MLGIAMIPFRVFAQANGVRAGNDYSDNGQLIRKLIIPAIKHELQTGEAVMPKTVKIEDRIPAFPLDDMWRKIDLSDPEKVALVN